MGDNSTKVDEKCEIMEACPKINTMIELTWGEKNLFGLHHYQNSPLRGLWGKKSSRNLSENPGGILLIGLLSMAFSVCFFIHPRVT